MRPDLISELSAPSRDGAMRVGLDLVQISRIAESLERFGAAFERKLFTPDELAYARAGRGLAAQRLAARFAAKEAVIKALQFSEAGIGWREIEVRRAADGDCQVCLHGRARELAAQRGAAAMALSLSHDGDYAAAVVAVALSCAAPTHPHPTTPLS